MLRKLVETGYLLGILDEAAKVRDFRRVLFHPRRLIGLAALASTETRLLSLRTSGVEAHVLGPCETGCARGAAVHTGGFDRVDECAVRGGAAGGNSGPALIR
jgi:hypothetical protein